MIVLWIWGLDRGLGFICVVVLMVLLDWWWGCGGFVWYKCVCDWVWVVLGCIVLSWVSCKIWCCWLDGCFGYWGFVMLVMLLVIYMSVLIWLGGYWGYWCVFVVNIVIDWLCLCVFVYWLWFVIDCLYCWCWVGLGVGGSLFRWWW